MHGDLAGLVYTVLLILFCWTVGFFIRKKKLFGALSEEVSRKFVHIGVSNFAFIYLYIFEGDLLPLAGLFAFAVINWIKEKYTEERRSWGTVEFPLSVAFMIILQHSGFGNRICVASSLLSMGYGDGLAAIVGKSFGKHRFPGSENKTWAGFITVFIVVFAVVLVFMDFSVLKTFVCAICAALAEVYTPFGLDNVTVPLIVYFLEVTL